MDREQKRKYAYIGLVAFIVVVACLIVVFAIFQFNNLRYILSGLWKILLPFVYGFVIAYMLLPIYNLLYRALLARFSRLAKRGKGERSALIWTKAISVTATMLFFFIIIYSFGLMVLPETVKSIVSIVNAAPETGRKLIAWVERMLADNPQLEELATKIISDYFDSLRSWAENTLVPILTGMLDTVYNSLLSTLTGMLTFLKDIVIGIIAAVYMLLNKTTYATQGKKLIYSVFRLPAANKIMQNLRYMHKVFSGFITGKIIDSLIIGVLCYIGMLILDMPYAMLISSIIGLTNVIPFFGPFIGAIPSALIILTVSPIKCVYFIIFIVLLQQFDGNILGPKILGGSTGLSSFWVMFAIIFFGGLFGLLGMIVGVPVFAVILSIVAALCRWSLGRKGLPVNTADYAEVDYFDEESRQPMRIERMQSKANSGERKRRRKRSDGGKQDGGDDDSGKG